MGGNPGTTKGQQALNAFNAAAAKWGQTIDSPVPIYIKAQFKALSCTATSATLGSAGTAYINLLMLNGLNVPVWFHEALYEKLTGAPDLDPSVGEYQINANFNSNLGAANCLAGTSWYLGLDGKAAANQIDLVTVLEHEFGHGLGFSVTPTNAQTGVRYAGYPSVWELFMYDNATSKYWINMTDTERAASTLNDTHLTWAGLNVVTSAPQVLVGPPMLVLKGTSVAGTYSDLQSASFGPYPTPTGVSAGVVRVVDAVGGLSLGCGAFTAASQAALAGKIALIDRGTCTFAVKAKNAQNAGAVGVLIANNAAGLPGMGGADATITIPSVGITQALGTAIKAQLVYGGRSASAVNATIGQDMVHHSGADSSWRVMLYAPTSFVGGSSVSHYDTRAFLNLLMEPNINSDLTHELTPPKDLTFPLFKDIGW